jgi:hypothetical protein
MTSLLSPLKAASVVAAASGATMTVAAAATTAIRAEEVKGRDI